MKRIIFLLILLALLPAGCKTSSSEPRTLKVMTHDSFAASEPVIQAFEAQYNVKLEFLSVGDTGTALNQAILSKDHPLADVFYGVDNTFLSRALDEDIFQPYESPLLSKIPTQFQLDPQFRALPVDYGDVCLNYDSSYLAGKGLNPPQALEDLLEPEYRGLLVVENPAASSPGLAFLLATIGHFGQSGYLDFWRGLKANGLLVVNDWETAYYTEFSAHGGTRPIVVSYASSPPFEVIYADPPVSKPPTGVIIGDETCFRQIEFVGILKGTAHQSLARKFVDFMLGAQFQADMPAQMFVYPVVPGIGLPEAFTKYSQVPSQPATLPPDQIATNRDAWIQAWTNAVLH